MEIILPLIFLTNIQCSIRLNWQNSLVLRKKRFLRFVHGKISIFLPFSKYDGYLLNGQHIYNPKSVVDVMRRKKFKSYWTGTETYEALKIYIDMNFDGLKEAITIMLGNARYKINTRKFQNDMTTFSTKDDILTLLIHLGYLTFDEITEEVSIPNQEIAWEFFNAIDNPKWSGVLEALQRSESLLERTWMMDEKAAPR